MNDDVIDIEAMATQVEKLKLAVFGPPPPPAIERTRRRVQVKAELAVARARREAIVAEHAMAGSPPSAFEHPASRGGLHAAVEHDELTATITRLERELAQLQEA
jgi:hypothetical protein